MDLCIEAHDRFTVGTAIRLGRQLEEFTPMWLETPVRTYDIAGHIEVARAINVPVVLGEGFHELRQFAELLSYRVIDIVQPEPHVVGPLAGAQGVRRGAGLSAHTWPVTRRRVPSARP